MRIFYIILLLLFLHSNSSALSNLYKSQVEIILEKRGLSIEAKSDRGWLRLLNNPERMANYSFSEDEKTEMQNYFMRNMKQERCANSKVLN